MSENTVELLKAARAKVAAGWAQGASARNVDGMKCEWDDAEARFFCAMGALWAADGSTGRSKASGSLDAALDVMRVSKGHTVISYNDSPDRRKEDVLKMYDVAIEIAGRAT